MRHYELTEALDFATEQTILNVAGTIKANCQPYLQQNKDAVNRFPMYRGVRKTNNANVIRKEVRLSDRKPKDMPYDLHQFINGYFKQNYGGAFRNGMFVSGSPGVSSEYGDTYIIFPAGEFQYLWSPHYEDLYSITSEYGFDQTPPSSEETIGWKEDAKQELEDGVLNAYQTDELEKGIDSGHEIMIRCSHYYGIHHDIMYNEELRNKIREVLYP